MELEVERAHFFRAWAQLKLQGWGLETRDVDQYLQIQARMFLLIRLFKPLSFGLMNWIALFWLSQIQACSISAWNFKFLVFHETAPLKFSTFLDFVSLRFLIFLYKVSKKTGKSLCRKFLPSKRWKKYFKVFEVDSNKSLYLKLLLLSAWVVSNVWETCHTFSSDQRTQVFVPFLRVVSWV